MWHAAWVNDEGSYPAKAILKRFEDRFIFQDLLWKESIFAIKHAVEPNNFHRFGEFLGQFLSSELRIRTYLEQAFHWTKAEHPGKKIRLSFK